MAEIPIIPISLPVEEEEPPAEPAKPKKKKKMSKAEKAEKKRQRQNEAKKKAMLHDFQEELELSRKTAKRLKSDWLEIIRESSLTELRQELVTWEGEAIGQLIKKDEKLQSLRKFLIEMEDTSDVVQGQLKRIFQYIGCVQKGLTDSNRLMYERSACEIVADFHNELNARTEFLNDRQLNCENIMHTTNIFCENDLTNDYKIFLDRRNDYVDEEIAKRYRLRYRIVKKMKETQQQLVQFVDEITFVPLDPKKYVKIRKLMNREQKFDNETKMLDMKEAKLRQQFSDLQREQLHLDMQMERKVNELRVEQSYFKEIRKTIQDRMQYDRELTLEKLRIASTEGFRVEKHYRKIWEFGELLLSITATVRRYQTEQEKILIWGDYASSIVNPTENEDFRKFVLTVIKAGTHIDRDNQELFNELNLMRVFWRRIAIVETQNELLAKEKEELLQQKEKYTKTIRSIGSSSKEVPKVLIKYVKPRPRDAY